MTNRRQKSRQLLQLAPRFRTLPIRGVQGAKPPCFGRLGKVLWVRIVKNGLVRLGYVGSGGQSPPV